MSGGNQLAAYLPYILGAVLVGGALAGGFMKAPRRAGFERYLLLPLYAIVAMSLVALKVWQHDWLLAAIWMLAGIFAVGTLYRRLRIVTRGSLS